MATLMDFIMAQRGDQSDPRFAANQQAMQLQNMARAAEQPAASATGAIAPNLPPPMANPPMSIAQRQAPVPYYSPPASQPPEVTRKIERNLYNFYRDNGLSAVDAIRQVDIARNTGMYDRVDPGVGRRLSGAMLAAEPEPGYNYENAPLPPRRPDMPSPRPTAAPMQIAPAPAAPSVREGFMQRLLGGPSYQSNNMPVVMSPQGPMASGGFLPQGVNYGDPESAADFFRADQAARHLGLLG